MIEILGLKNILVKSVVSACRISFYRFLPWQLPGKFKKKKKVKFHS